MALGFRSRHEATSQPQVQSDPLRPHGHSRGQMLVVFVMSLFVIMGSVAFVVDISWYWASGLRAQRAADAAALAGVVYLPGNVAQAITTAKAAAAANGYVDGVGGVVVTPSQDNADDRRMNVTINAPVGTFFARIFGITVFQSSKKAKAEFVLSVPMGSPQNYYGVDTLRRAVGATIPVPDASGSGNLASQGAWGAVITKGGDHGNGDAYSPTWDSRRGQPTRTTTPTATRMRSSFRPATATARSSCSIPRSAASARTGVAATTARATTGSRARSPRRCRPTSPSTTRTTRRTNGPTTS